MVYINDLQPDVVAEIKSAAQKVAEEIVPDDEVTVFFTGERTHFIRFSLRF